MDQILAGGTDTATATDAEAISLAGLGPGTYFVGVIVDGPAGNDYGLTLFASSTPAATR